VDVSSITVSPDQASFKAGVKSSLYPDIKFELELRVHDDGVVRVRMDEVDGLRKRYDETASWALISEPTISKEVKWTVGKKDIHAIYGAKKENEIVVAFQPLRIALLRNGKEQIVLNEQGLLHMEHFRTKTPEVVNNTEESAPVDGQDQVVMKAENPRAWFEGDKEDDWWEETFSTWTDSKPKGMQRAPSRRLLSYAVFCQVPNPCRWTSHSRTMARSTASHNTPRDSLSLPLRANLPSSVILTVYTTLMFSSILLLPQCLSTDLFPFFTPTPPAPP
jgi:hypothetical protein